jgi:hypothetical protein
MHIISDIHGTVFKNGSATLLARVVGHDGEAIVRADIASARYSIYLLDDDDADSRTAVTGHSDVSLTVADVLFDTLQTGPLWTVDAAGYNFCHQVNVSSHPAFAIAGRRYLVEYRLAPHAGQVIVVRFRVNVV